MALNKSYTFTNNTIVDPAEVNQNFDDLIAHIRAAHHRDVDGTKISYQDIATGWGLVPSGGIMFWSGLISAIPTGYVFCNGANSTPDMRNKFGLCPGQDSGGTYDTGDVGGSETINIAHVHAGPNHRHYMSFVINAWPGGNDYDDTVGTDGLDKTPAGSDHQHQVIGYTEYEGTENTGSALSAAQAVMNPFKALVYMMKT